MCSFQQCCSLELIYSLFFVITLSISYELYPGLSILSKYTQTHSTTVLFYLWFSLKHSSGTFSLFTDQNFTFERTDAGEARCAQVPLTTPTWCHCGAVSYSCVFCLGFVCKLVSLPVWKVLNQNICIFMLFIHYAPGVWGLTHSSELNANISMLTCSSLAGIVITRPCLVVLHFSMLTLATKTKLKLTGMSSIWS